MMIWMIAEDHLPGMEASRDEELEMCSLHTSLAANLVFVASEERLLLYI